MNTTQTPKRKREPIPMSEVLEWLQTHQPHLHETAEVDRDWLWIVADLRGEHNKAVRNSIKEYGFRFAIQGHPLPSGNIAHWGHSCNRPTRFKRRDKHNRSEHNESDTATNPTSANLNPASKLDLDAIASAFA